MNEQITSAAELDALPVGSVVLDAYAAACTRVRQQDMYDWVRASSAAPNGGKHFHPPYFPATVLYRPDQPQQPTVAEVKAEAWDEGHRHAWRRGPDDCTCSAWASIECACGRFGSGELLSLADNPYREARP